MSFRILAPFLLLALPLMAKSAAPQEIKQAERIVLIGNGLGERMLDHPYFEAGIQLANPGKDIIVRNMCRSGETPGFRPHPSRNSPWAFPGAEKFHPDMKKGAGSGTHPTPDEWLKDIKPDTMLAFFGYNESFDGDAGLENFRGELDAWVKYTLEQKYNGKAAPRLVLVSPIAFENLSASRDLPDGEKENVNLANYTKVMSEVAEANGVEFIDFFNGTRELYATLDEPFTRNGFLPTDAGYRILGNKLATSLYSGNKPSSAAKPDAVLAAVKDKNWYWQNDYRMLNDVHVDGRRFKPYGPDNYPDEKKKMREMTEVRDKAIWAATAGKAFDLALADSQTHKLPVIKTNYTNRNKKNGDPDYKTGEESEKLIKTPEGYKVELFASEKDFPNLANPVQISFDDKGRLWVATMPTYPHYRPGDALPDDKLLIYEDTDGDGKADKETVFADKLHLPIGLEFAPGGVYVSLPPHLVWLPDADGDDKADSKEVVLTGFDSHDTHHAISAFCADPSGAFMMGEGLFLHSNVETPYGTVRGVDGGFYRFCPQKTKLERTTQVSIPNPWGYAFDEWGQDFFIHTSGTAWNWNLPVSMNPTYYGARAPGTIDLAPRGNHIRPSSGHEFIYSRHFPDEVQGDALIGNNIGFLGLKQHSIVDDGTGYKTAFRQDLLSSSDSNFRPSDFEFAPDGSLYVLDWHNVLIGHMQHNARDPFRDHVHGRIYRVTYPSRPLVEPAEVAGASVETLLENLKLPEYRTRYRSRRALRGHPVEEVMPALSAWVKSIDAADPRSEHHRLEALWVSWGMNQVDTALLRELLNSKDFHARAAAVRVLRYNFDRFPDDAAKLLQQAAADENGRVRLEAGMAATWFGKPGAAKTVSIAKEKGTDEWSKDALNTAASRIGGEVEEEVEENPLPDYPKHLSKNEKKQFKLGHEIYFREGHCGTCHQADGKGLAPAFPPLENSIFVHGDAERLIKLTLHGLIGPFEMNGIKYDGQVPMTPFGGMLPDEEIAAVLTYVRNQFGNEASAITVEQVKEVREKTKDMTGLYQMEELLKEHPLEK
jgi:mono/diheme cytochrome c family protein/glucose/arabinose dehydrogenase